MGVFARLFRRSRTGEEASTAGAGTDTPGTAPAAEATAGTAEAAESGPRNTVGTDKPADPAGSGAAEPGDTDSDGVGIPKQQSAGEAVDNEADESART